VFHVKASNNDGVWNEKEARLTIVILPPWYQTIWAIIGYIMLFAAVFFAAIRVVIHENHLKNNIRLEKLSKEKEQELNQMKLRFFTNISHEFKTPLTLINGYIDQIATMVKGDQVIKEKLAKARLNSQRLLKLINQLIDFRKSEQDVLRLNKRNENIIQVIRQVVDSFQAFADQNNITLAFHSEMEFFLVLIDRDKIEDVLYNIISNAIKFNYPHGKVDIYINQDKKKNMLEISVADTGIGIAPQNMDKLFDRFYQITDQPVSVPVTPAGSGIGLSFARKLVELHGGTITAESNLGKGSVFRVSIPLGIDHLQAIPQIVSLKTEPESVQKEYISTNKRIMLSDKNAPVILVVEDNSEMREFICSILWDEYRVEEAENGKTGLDMAIQDNPHLIISDIMMPVMDGITMCKALKTNLSTSHIPVVLLSAKNDIDTKLESMGLNADDFIEKPFSPEYLKARVKNILEIRENLKSHFSQGNDDESTLSGLNPVDQQFLEKSNKIIEERISDPDFSVNILARELSLNRVQLYRKFSSITGLLPKDYIKQIRLNKAAKLLRERQLTVAEIGYAVGYSAPSNFNFAFKAYYGKTPKEYQEGY
jgi:signal transduction histidine kinase/DNA-binding response OmpR family regulator